MALVEGNGDVVPLQQERRLETIQARKMAPIRMSLRPRSSVESQAEEEEQPAEGEAENDEQPDEGQEEGKPQQDEKKLARLSRKVMQMSTEISEEDVLVARKKLIQKIKKEKADLRNLKWLLEHERVKKEKKQALLQVKRRS